MIINIESSVHRSYVWEPWSGLECSSFRVSPLLMKATQRDVQQTHATPKLYRHFKKKVVKERRCRVRDGQTSTQQALAEWVKAQLCLTNIPGKAIMSRIFKDPALQDEKNVCHIAFCFSRPRHIELDKALYAWVCDMFHKNCCSGWLNQEKARRLAAMANGNLSKYNQTTLKLSDGWFASFRRRWNLKSFTLRGESGDVDEATITPELLTLQTFVGKYSLIDDFNCGEARMFWQMAPDRIISNV